MSFEDLSPAKRRWVVARTLLRAAATTVVLVALYYLLPLDHASEAASAALLALGVVGVAAVIAWEVRTVIKSDYPGLRAVEALAAITPLFLLLFSATYYLLERAAPPSFNQHLTRTDALYFTVTTFSTVGYGDITARSQVARVIVIIQIVADLILLGFGVKALISAVQMTRQRRAGDGRDGTSTETPAPPSGSSAQSR